MARSSKKNKPNVENNENTAKSTYTMPSAKVLKSVEVVDGKNPDEFFKGVDFDKIADEFEKKHRPKPPILATVPARILGACVIFVIIVAVILSVFGIRAGIDAKQAEDMKIQAVSDYLSPVVSIGIQPFEKADTLDAMTKLRCCALYAIENNSEELKQNDLGKTLLPTYMIKSAAENLFGEGITLSYYSFDINGSLFEYDSMDKCYMFSASGVSSTYTPQIVAYSQKDSIISARVKYIAANGEINAYNDMEFNYKIKKQNGVYTIISIKKAK